MCLSSPRAADIDDVQKLEINAQARFAPKVYELNSKYSPLYTQLGLQNLSSFLTGSSKNASGGLTDLFASGVIPQLTSATDQANSASRRSMVNDVLRLAPDAAEATRAMNPFAAHNIDTAAITAGAELALGRNLTQGQQYQLDQSSRGGAAARGMGHGPSDVFAESMAELGYGDNLLSQRMSNATGTAMASQNFYGDPFAKIANTTSTGANSGMSLLGMGQASIAPSQSAEFNPEGVMAQQRAQNSYDATKTVSQEKFQGLSSGLSSAASY